MPKSAKFLLFVAMISGCNISPGQNHSEPSTDTPAIFDAKFSRLNQSDIDRLTRTAEGGDIDSARTLVRFYANRADRNNYQFWQMWLSDRGDVEAMRYRSSQLYSSSLEYGKDSPTRRRLLELSLFFARQVLKYDQKARMEKEYLEYISILNKSLSY